MVKLESITKEIQQRLIDLGWLRDKADGVWGPKSSGAFEYFGIACGTNDPGVTLHGLFSDAAPVKETPKVQTIVNKDLAFPHVALAKTLVGTKEHSGSASNPAILAWARTVGVDGIYRDDATSWCGLFMAYVIVRSYKEEKLDFNVLGARQWLKFGRAVTPGYGSILVFWRGSKSGWEGHVGVYVGEDATHYYVLGGNQDDMVCVKKLPKGRLLGARAPFSVSIEKMVPVQMTGNYQSSKSEA